jgi:APA family basic amino acid/polyamine antiporter
MAGAEHKQSIGVVMTSAIVVGTIIGSGIFLLPASLAPLGINAAIGWVLSGIGALCVAFALSRIVRPEGGGLQSYVEAELGPVAGFVVTFALWVSSWTAMAATAIAAAAALSRVVPHIGDPWSVAMIAIVTTIVVAAVNSQGVRAAGGFALVTVAIRILPLLAVIAVLLLREVKHQAVAPLAHTPITTNNIATAVTLTLFAIIGFETGTAPVGKVRNPTRTIPLALMAGTAFCVLLYLFSSTSVSMILSPEATATSLAPYADALKSNWGEGAAKLAAIGIAIAAIGGLNSNLLCAGEVGYSMALRGDLPSHLARTTGANTPVISQLLATVLTVVLVLLNTSKSTTELFLFVILLTTTSTLIVYVVGAVAALRTRPSMLAVLAIAASIIFSLFAFYGAGLQANLWGLALLAVGLAIRWLCHRLRRSQGGSTPLEAASPAAPPGSSA